MRIRIPSVLFSYTDGQKYVDANGTTLREVLEDLDTKFPGIKFRFITEKDQVREHMQIFIDGKSVSDLSIQVMDEHEIFITQTIGGG